MNWHIGERVEIMHWDDAKGNRTGKVIGTATIVEDCVTSLDHPVLQFRTLVIVKLDEGFYDPSRTCYVSCLPVSNESSSIRSLDR
jgi:hypothetical protein